MTRSYSSLIQDQLESSEYSIFNLLKMTIAATDYTYTDCDVPITYGGTTYDPLGFSFNPVKYSMANIVDKVTIQIDNLGSVFSGLFVGSTVQGSPAILYTTILDSTHAVVGGLVTLFEGEIDSWIIDETMASITITSILSHWSQKTYSKYSPSCRWGVFGTTDYDECNYGGATTWCDRTYKQCVVLNNSSNFGGFRWLPSIVDKDVWWGPKQK